MKEFWIRILSWDEQGGVMDYIASLSEDNLGSIPVVLHCTNTNTQKRLPFAYSLADHAAGELKKKFGADNAKLVVRHSVDDSLGRIADAFEAMRKPIERLAVLADCIAVMDGEKQLRVISETMKFDE